nr:hypothetical protein [Tanacetum cinerariifolium]
ADGEADRDADAEASSEAGVRIDIRDEAYMKDYDTDIKADIAADAEVDTQIGVEAEIEAEAKESDRDTIKIGVDVVYPDPDNLFVFPMRENRCSEAERITLRVRVRSLGIIETSYCCELVEHEDAIQGIHEHLLEMPTQRLEEIEDELRV